jgi:outer membrane protein
MPSRQLFVALLAAASLLAPRLAGAAEFKLAYVDVQRAIGETDEGKAARTRLEAARDAKQKEIDKEQEVLRKEKETFEKQVATMTEATRTEKGTALQKKIYDLQQKFEKGRAELSEQEREAFLGKGGIVEKMQVVIASIAQRDGFTVILDRAATVYAAPSLDVTNEAIRLYNEKYKAPASASSTTPKKADAPKK